MTIWQRIKGHVECWRRGYHLYVYDSETLGGDLIKCRHCGHLEEFLPGLHEPKGYDYEAARQARLEGRR